MTLSRILFALLALFAVLAAPAHADSSITAVPETHGVFVLEICDPSNSSESDVEGESHHHGCTGGGIAYFSSNASLLVIGRGILTPATVPPLTSQNGAPPHHPPLV